MKNEVKMHDFKHFLTQLLSSMIDFRVRPIFHFAVLGLLCSLPGAASGDQMIQQDLHSLSNVFN